MTTIIDGSAVYSQDRKVVTVKLHVQLGPAEGFFAGYIDFYGNLRLTSLSPAEVKILSVLYSYLASYEDYIVEKIKGYIGNEIDPVEFKF